MLKSDLKKRCEELEELLHQEQNSTEYWMHEFNKLYEEKQQKKRGLLGEFKEDLSNISLTKSIELREVLNNFFAK